MKLDNEQLRMVTDLLMKRRDYHDSHAQNSKAEIFYWILNVPDPSQEKFRVPQLLKRISDNSQSSLEVADVIGALACALHMGEFRSDIVSHCLSPKNPFSNQASIPGLFLGTLEMANTYHSTKLQFRDSLMKAMKEGYFKRAVVINSSFCGRLSQQLALYMENIWSGGQPKTLEYVFELVTATELIDVRSPLADFHGYLLNELMSKLFLGAPTNNKQTILVHGKSIIFGENC